MTTVVVRGRAYREDTSPGAVTELLAVAMFARTVRTFGRSEREHVLIHGAFATILDWKKASVKKSEHIGAMGEQ